MRYHFKQIAKVAFIILATLTVLVSIPYVINYLVLGGHLPFNNSVAGSNDVEQAWLVFWSNYLGCVVSSIVTFVVLYLSLRQNNTQNNRNREEAHNENSLLREAQDKQIRYERAMRHVSEIRATATSMYHSVVNSTTDEIYTIITLDNYSEIDFKHIRTLLITALDEINRSYIEMQMLLSYDGTRDEETDKLMGIIKRMSDESYACVSDLVKFFILCKSSSTMSDEAIKTEIYKYVADKQDRIQLPNYKIIWDIIIEEGLVDIRKNQSSIALKWHDEWVKINDLYLVSLRGLVSHYFQMAQSLIN